MAEEQENQQQVEVPEKFQDIVERIEQMSVLELSELVKVLEDRLGVSAAAPVAAAPAAAGGGGDEAAGEEEAEQTSFDVVINDGGSSKIQVVKTVKSETGLGLKEAKEIVDNPPGTIKEGMDKESAQELVNQIQELGADVEMK
ncbi:MAG: 50S ribosomal protein L7/L12 [Parcubacteria group bacterium SW_4_49_11]|jgi:large subunit ribosomal protein L7/L12|nr:MAG: 50S ribosomal protein L7/L12 [Parcubacteria group bacterium SW_4_49_11]